MYVQNSNLLGVKVETTKRPLTMITGMESKRKIKHEYTHWNHVTFGRLVALHTGISNSWNTFASGRVQHINKSYGQEKLKHFVIVFRSSRKINSRQSHCNVERGDSIAPAAHEMLGMKWTQENLHFKQIEGERAKKRTSAAKLFNLIKLCIELQLDVVFLGMGEWLMTFDAITGLWWFQSSRRCRRRHSN